MDYIMQNEFRSLVCDVASFVRQETGLGPKLSLLHACHNQEEILFLSKVVEAICKNITPASLQRVATIESFKRQTSLKLILAPVTLLSLNAQPHEIIYEKFPLPILTLAPISEYLKDAHLKRQLWNILKSAPIQNMLK